MFYRWAPYVSAAERRRQALRAAAKQKKNGETTLPVVLDGHAIATTFWGKAWCSNLERYSDYENRLPRGRAYVRNGSVIDLRIAPGDVTALVSGSSLYTVQARIAAVPKAKWHAICADCTGAIDSLVELLQGRFSKAVMERICRRDTGLFPSPKEIRFTCSCPDWAAMCKHVAAVLYGVGARLDRNPALLFALRKVDHLALVAAAGRDLSLGAKGPGPGKVLKTAGLAELFGIDLLASAGASTSEGKANRGKRRRSPQTVAGQARGKKSARMPVKPKAVAVKRAAVKPGARRKAAQQRPSRHNRD